jgi:hypothetical protein
MMPVWTSPAGERALKSIQSSLAVTFTIVSFATHSIGLAQRPAHVWEMQGFQAFRAGGFDSAGANLYVSRRGVVQTVHRWDVNNDGYFDLIFNNTHDLVYSVPTFEYRFTGSVHVRDRIGRFDICRENRRARR